jgi:hypothetical protein
MKLETLKYTLVNKIRIVFSNIWKAIELLQNYDKSHGPDTYSCFRNAEQNNTAQIKI